MTEPTYPLDPQSALKQWRAAALDAEQLRVELKAAQAAAYIDAALPEGLKATDASREAYATAQTADLAKRAAAAAVEAKASERWAQHLLAWAIIAAEPRQPEPTSGSD